MEVPLEIAFEIATGEFAGFYRRNFDAQTQEDKKWKGIMRLYVPKEDGTDKDEWTKKTFKRATQAIEDSNPGYQWDWNEKGLKGKIVGCLSRQRVGLQRQNRMERTAAQFYRCSKSEKRRI